MFSLLYGPTLTSVHDHWKNHPFDYMDLCQQSDVSAFSLSQLIIAFLPRIKHLLISWLQSLSEVILEPRKIKCVTVSIFSPSICHEVMGTDTMILVLSQLFHSPFHLHREASFLLISLLPLNMTIVLALFDSFSLPSSRCCYFPELFFNCY